MLYRRVPRATRHLLRIAAASGTATIVGFTACLPGEVASVDAGEDDASYDGTQGNSSGTCASTCGFAASSSGTSASSSGFISGFSGSFDAYGGFGDAEADAYDEVSIDGGEADATVASDAPAVTDAREDVE